MATNTAPSDVQDASPRTLQARRKTITPGRAVIALGWAVAVLLLLVAIVHVAQEQVDKGSSLQNPPQGAPSASRFYSSNDGAHLADLKPASSTPASGAEAS